MRLPHRAPSLLSTFDDVPGVELVDVTLRRTPAPAPHSRTIQTSLHPMFTRTYELPKYPLRVAVVPQGCLVTESGAVLDSGGKLVGESLWDEDHLRRLTPDLKRLPRPRRLPGRHASLMSLWCNNYFHWMFNSLPRLAVLEASGVEWDTLLVPAELTAFQRETLAMLGFTSERLTPFDGGSVQVDELVWAAPLAPINEPSTFLLEWVRGRFGDATASPTRRVYVSRQGTRRAANEEVVFAALEPLGFEFLVPERLSFRDQVRTFAETAVAVGPHGSNFVNGIFSQKLSVLEFFQPAHVNWGVYTILCAAGVDHWHCIAPPVRSARRRRFDDLEISVDEMMKSLLAMNVI